jgi:septal ring factor EnvC (AmiA/AmiB activator)
MRVFLACLFLAVSGTVAVDAAQDVAVRADRARALLDEAATSLGSADGAPDRVVALTKAIHAYEAGLEALRESVRQAKIRESAIAGSLEAEREQLGRLLGVLQTLERTPDPVTLVHPTGPLGAARAGMMVSDLTPAVAERTLDLKTRLDDLVMLRELQSSASSELETSLVGLREARLSLSQTIAKRVRLPKDTDPDPVLLGLLSAGSDTLEEFVVGLQDYRVPAPQADFRSFKGSLRLPANSAVLRGYRAADRAGIERPGLVLATPDQALVVAPVAASVRYVGTLLDYGNVIVLEPEAAYLLILSGVDQVYVRPGDIVGSGEPLALMGGSADGTGAIAGGQSRRETLYLELRNDGNPVDPGEWFVTDEG